MQEPTWTDIETGPYLHTPIRYWSPLRGYTAGTFTIDLIRGNRLQLTGRKKAEVVVYRRDFERIVALTDSYAAREINSRELRKISGRPVYIFSLVQEHRRRSKSSSVVDSVSYVHATPDELHAELNRVLARAQQRARQGGQVISRTAPNRLVTLSKSDLSRLWKEQKGKCGLCARPIPLHTENSLLQLSIDRIDSRDSGYCSERVHLAHLGCNFAKNAADLNGFGEWLALIRGKTS